MGTRALEWRRLKVTPSECTCRSVLTISGGRRDGQGESSDFASPPTAVGELWDFASWCNLQVHHHREVVAVAAALGVLALVAEAPRPADSGLVADHALGRHLGRIGVAGPCFVVEPAG